MPDPKKKYKLSSESNQIDPDKGKKPIVVKDKNDPRYKSYTDSLNLYNAYLKQDALMGKGNKKISGANQAFKEFSMASLKDARTDKFRPALGYKLSDDYSSEKDQFKDGYNETARKEDKKLIEYYKSLPFNDKIDIMYHSSPDLIHSKIKPIGTYFDGTAESPIYKKPEQEILLKSLNKNSSKTPLVVSSKNESHKKLTSINLQEAGLSHDFKLNSSPELVPLMSKAPKSWKVQENINNPGGFGDRQTNYTVSDPRLINSNDLGPNNTRKVTPQYAMGGTIDSPEAGNNLNAFNTGGTHEQNPLGGIPQGDNGQGQMNTVEQGETSFKIKGQKFIFSNRITI